MFRGTPVTRARYSGFLRNVAVAMGNARLEKFRAPLESWRPRATRRWRSTPLGAGPLRPGADGTFSGFLAEESKDVLTVPSFRPRKTFLVLVEPGSVSPGFIMVVDA